MSLKSSFELHPPHFWASSSSRWAHDPEGSFIYSASSFRQSSKNTSLNLGSLRRPPPKVAIVPDRKSSPFPYRQNAASFHGPPTSTPPSGLTIFRAWRWSHESRHHVHQSTHTLTRPETPAERMLRRRRGPDESRGDWRKHPDEAEHKVTGPRIQLSGLVGECPAWHWPWFVSMTNTDTQHKTGRGWNTSRSQITVPQGGGNVTPRCVTASRTLP